MQTLKRLSLIEQTAGHLRQGFEGDRWQGKLPGVGRLALDLGVSKDTVRAALQLLEHEGCIKAQGAGRNRLIVPSKLRPKAQRTLRIAVLLVTPLELENAHSQRLILRLVSSIEHLGHECLIIDRVVNAVKHSPARLNTLVQTTAADAWIVYAAGRELLTWFVQKKIPVMALGGRSQDLPVACTRTDISDAMHAAIDHLAQLGHRRIVLISYRLWRFPVRGPGAESFLQRLAHHDLPASDFNLPDWEETPEGLQNLLNSLFQTTPPTALLLVEPSYTVATFAFLAKRGLRVPEDVSIISLMPDSVFLMRRPIIAHFEWPVVSHIRRITRWVQALALGRADHEVKSNAATFIPGGTIGPCNSARL